ncbi:hypothetical protein BU24DRAFT_170442 [Aaosphaeria arxii CBS 175.79]|uniref:RING-type E3 ubiquitin transferase n=1 Tax=Aaosphaeria arxii CBS 175.79 TaxID=1450172 RepID=A0A6A5XZJ7_9PLEO|nr:uncharacterized protein BU24DRAFT_170442 [Aaosphaeria arxii CBS 175.79]KAF2018409.1 hypothetical protein BU24DRAFT_170442 [Aaosphaeria arxii CBS 175.79]
MTRLQLYVAGSTVLANIVLLRAYYERPNFYSAAVYISQSTGSLMFLINLALIITGSIGYGLQRLFYGPLRAIETEQLYDKAWFAVSETLLAMTIFRDDIGIWFFAMFLCLLGGKVWQWIGEGRVEYLEQQPPANPRLFHIRLMSSLLFSVAFDVVMMQYCIDHILQNARPGVMVMFGFEYVLLAIASISSLLRYALSLVEIVVVHRQEKARVEARRLSRERAREQAAASENAGEPTEQIEEDEDEDEGDVPGWEEKGRWVFYLDLATDFIKSVVYIGFFMILMAFYGIPLHIMRDLFMTLRSFIKRVNDFIQYRNATRDMNARYPDATVEELERENTCIVCREEMRPWNPDGAAAGQQAGRRVDERQRPKKLPCGHILHFSCLRSWLERQQVCPTCRRPVLVGGAQNNQNTQANAGNQNPQNQANAQQLRGFANLRNDLQNQIQRGQPGAPPPQAPNGAQQQGDQPGGNMRVYNFGPIRLALGRFPNAQEAVNNLNANGMHNAAQQVAQNLDQGQNQAQNQHQTPVQDHELGLPQLPGLEGGLPPAVYPHHPTDIQADILRLQYNIISSLRQLNIQHSQLEYIHALLGELNRLQQASGITAASGQELPIIAPLSQNLGFNTTSPQAYFSSGPVLRQGDTGLPEGLVLPEGWTLRPMAPSSQPTNDQLPSFLPNDVATGAVGGEQLPSSSTSSAPAQAEQEQQPSSSAPPTESSPGETTSKQAEPSSLESSWSFGNLPGANVAEGSSSAVAERGTEGEDVTRRRAVTVEDVEDNEQ